MGLWCILNVFGVTASYWDLQVLPSGFEDHLRSACVNSHLPVTKVFPHLLVLRLRTCVSAKLSPMQVNKGAAVGKQSNAQPLPVSWWLPLSANPSRWIPAPGTLEWPAQRAESAAGRQLLVNKSCQ